MTETYNGWSNYETWVVNLWMGNEEYTYKGWRETARHFSEKENPEYQLAEAMKETHENPVECASVFSDLLGAALGQVDWYEIAKSWLADVAESVTPSRTAGPFKQEECS